MSRFFEALEQAKRDRALPAGAQPKAPSPGEGARPELRDRQPAAAPEPAADLPDGVDEHLVSLLTPTAFEAERYRALRHIIGQLHEATSLKLVAVSSPAVGDGKTVTTINLAGALAQAPGARVLLVDADLRRPSIGSLLGLDDPRIPDLASAIENSALTLDDIARPCPPFNLSVICGAEVSPSSYEVLKSPRLGELMADARRRYDYVVLDAPPLVAVPDCWAIAGCVDGFLIVVAADRTPRKLLEEALSGMNPDKVIGLVFNGDARPVAQSYEYGNSEASNGDNRGVRGRAPGRTRAMLRRGRAWRR